MRCKFPDKACKDSYVSHGVKDVVKCRLFEWKRKFGVCPYDSGIRSKLRTWVKRAPPGQTRLEELNE